MIAERFGYLQLDTPERIWNLLSATGEEEVVAAEEVRDEAIEEEEEERSP